MQHNQNSQWTIPVLCITAVILLVGVILTFSGQNEAMAIGQIDRGGDYLLCTGQFTENTEIVYITDAAAQRMNMYSYETTTRALVLWDTVDFKQIFGAGNP